MENFFLQEGCNSLFPSYRAYASPLLMNLEVTTQCPFRCPQCYCNLENGKHLEFETARYWIEEAAREGVKAVNLSGGESLCYPFLDDLISLCNEKGLMSNVALSGAYVTKERLMRLIDSGVTGIYVSLNGSTEEINSKTRDGYALAIESLRLLRGLHDQIGWNNTGINWVMHNNNAEDFPAMLNLAEEYKVNRLDVMMFKPDSKKQMKSIPSGEQVRAVVKSIKEYKGSVQIGAEPCFSQMRALLGKRALLNLNIGIQRGCGAGRDGFSVNIDGKLTPCRHLDIGEEFHSLRDYWYNSPVLQKLRTMEDNMKAPCRECQYNSNCIPCAAVNYALHGKLYMGDESCQISPSY